MDSGSMLAGGNPYGPSGPPPPGLSSHIPPTPPPDGSGMYPGPGMTRPLTNVQLQQLSAQIRAYRMLARNMAPPDVLLSIVHGRKPTPAMIAQAQAQMQQQYSRTMSQQQQPPSTAQGGQLQSFSHVQKTGSTGNIANMATPSPSAPTSSDTGINLYPPSPSTSQSNPLPPSISTGTTVAPNVTLTPGGELPLAVKQAANAANLARSLQENSAQPVTSTSSGPTAQQNQQQLQQQQGKTQLALKQMKLTPVSKPPGIDPMVVMKERETRYMS